MYCDRHLETHCNSHLVTTLFLQYIFTYICSIQTKSNIMKGNIRKIIVGDSYTYNIKYVKGSTYRVGERKCTLTDFIVHEDEIIDIYVTDGNSTFIWKTINSTPLEIEYDVNFK